MLTAESLLYKVQCSYHNAVVEPFRDNMFRNLSRLDHLVWKGHLNKRVHVVEHDRDWNPRMRHGGLTAFEWLELTYLRTIWNINRKYGDEPFGQYPKIFLEKNGDGTMDKPYRPALGYNIFKAIPGLIRLAGKSNNGIYVDPACARGYDPLVLVTPDFEFIAAKNGVAPESLLSRLLEEALENPHLMRRESKGRFDETIEWYKNHARQYAEAIDAAVSEEQINAFTQHLVPGSKILDVGANAGRDEKQFAERGYKVTGLDLVYESLEIAKEDNPESLQVNCNMLATPFPDAYFDGVWTHASMHHLNSLDDFRVAINEQKRILRRDGILHIATQAKTDKLRTAIVVDELTKEPRQFLYVTAQELSRILNRSGFSVIDIQGHREVEDKNGTQRKAVLWLIALAKKA